MCSRKLLCNHISCLWRLRVVWESGSVPHLVDRTPIDIIPNPSLVPCIILLSHMSSTAAESSASVTCCIAATNWPASVLLSFDPDPSRKELFVQLRIWACTFGQRKLLQAAPRPVSHSQASLPNPAAREAQMPPFCIKPGSTLADPHTESWLHAVTPRI